jgi:hypothetical protein
MAMGQAFVPALLTIPSALLAQCDGLAVGACHAPWQACVLMCAEAEAANRTTGVLICAGACMSAGGHAESGHRCFCGLVWCADQHHVVSAGHHTTQYTPSIEVAASAQATKHWQCKLCACTCVYASWLTQVTCTLK